MSLISRTFGPLARILLATALALGIVGVIVLFASPFVVSGSSMTSTLQSGEVVLVDRANPATGLQRGEVVVFYPPNGSRVSYIKRLIGLPGDHVAIRGGLVYVNGTRLNETYLTPGTATRTGRRHYELTVPNGTVFVLGDDRSGSWDSRGFGPVPISSILGRAWVAFDAGALAVL